MIIFKLAHHHIRNVEIVEIHLNGILVGVLYPEKWGVRLVSKFLEESSISVDLDQPRAINVKLP